ncbi:hypothetical protein A6A04_18045 [Paramagnetospirillum marisnigri]|uniref:N-acetyltransferase domain-containing protein n=1 Tax=Paramagnetospirillum marisnigri TaxID=1285242 RepID=A0A178MQW7_9PROT|nr:GNAT family N-acetyltransferase [Paramagnetospirillum marisnigri]OAN50498.1 hypothetical protein A6A04_18045 [Paramagnetospirillum marisnigri]
MFKAAPLLRAMTPDDMPALIALFRASVRQVARRDYHEEQLRAWAPDSIDLTEWTQRHGDRPGWVAVTDGSLSGFCELETDGHLDMMFVHPDRQGQGIASALLVQTESVARQWGLTRLFTEASLTARPFFEARGFQIIESQVVTVRGQDFINIRMEKGL